jgi:hypothetical protein
MPENPAEPFTCGQLATVNDTRYKINALSRELGVAAQLAPFL